MSQNGQPRFKVPAHFGAVAAGSFSLRFGERFPTHMHSEHQLAWSEQGMLAATIGERTWILHPTCALFIPGRLPHSIEAASLATMCSVYFRPRSSPVRFRVPTVVAITPLVAELIRSLAREDLTRAVRTHAQKLLGALLVPLPAAPLELPLPRDPRARRITDSLLERPDDVRTLGALAKSAGASGRTLARLFVSETGMTFGRWRTQLRLRAALAHLANGEAVSEVAERVGYESISAFVAAFRRHLGAPPGTFLRSAPRTL